MLVPQYHEITLSHLKLIEVTLMLFHIPKMLAFNIIGYAVLNIF